MQKTILSVLLATCIVSINSAHAKTNTSWQLSPDSLGPIKVGMTVEQAEKAAQTKLSVEPFGPTAVTEDCRFATLKDGPKEIHLMLNKKQPNKKQPAIETIVRIDVKNAAIKTAEGIHVGSTTDEVKKLYKGKMEVFPNKYEAHNETLVVTLTPKSNYRLVFDTDKGKIAYMRAGQEPQVTWVEGCG